MENFSPKTATQYAIESLRKELLNNTIKAGTRLRQDEIAKKLGISTTPVREALKQLSAEGLIISDAYKGCIVKGLCVEDLDEIYDLRVLLETKLMQASFKDFNDENIFEIEQIWQDMQECGEDVEKWTYLNGEFHTKFWMSKKDSLLFSFVENLKTQSIPYISLSLLYMPEHIKKSDKTHHEILQAYKAKNIDLATKLNELHLNDTKHIIYKTIKNM